MRNTTAVLMTLLTTTLLLTNVGTHCVDAAEFAGLGDLPGGDFLSIARDISSDGKTIVGYSAVDTYEYRPGDERPVTQAFRWSMEAGMQSLGRLPGLPASNAQGVSADGSVIVGYAQDPGTPLSDGRQVAFRWTEQDGMVALDPLDSPTCSIGNSARGISEDGTTIVGTGSGPEIPDWGCPPQAMRHTNGSPIGLGFGDDGGRMLNRSLAISTSADGSVVAGHSTNVDDSSLGIAWLWDEETGTLTDLGFRSRRLFVRVTDMTPDAKYVIGYGIGNGLPGPTGFVEPFLWTEEDGAVPLDVPTLPTSISNDGRVIVGGSNRSTSPSWVWTQFSGVRDITEALSTDFALAGQMIGWDFTEPAPYGGSVVMRPNTRISGDGRTLVSTGTNPDGNIEAWVAILDRPIQWIPGDADHDYDVDFADFLKLSEHFGQSGVWEDGDFDLNGTVEFADFLALSQNFGVQPASPRAVPEPSAMTLLGVALLVFVRVPRRQWDRRSQ